MLSLLFWYLTSLLPSLGVGPGVIMHLVLEEKKHVEVWYQRDSPCTPCLDAAMGPEYFSYNRNDTAMSNLHGNAANLPWVLVAAK